MRLCPLILALALALGQGAAAAATLTVFGAASLTDALEEIGRAFGARTATAVRFSFAASSTLARQIEAGAPADVVALASDDWAAYLAERALIDPGTLIEPITNRLAVVAPWESRAALSDPPTAPQLLAALGPHGRLAIGDPAHVPAGIYGREALETLGLWEVAEPRLARADNTRAALALVARGEAPLGIVYDTDARAPGIRVLRLLPATAHAPIRYAFAAVAGGNAAMAREFLAFLASDEGLAAFEQHGFTRR